MFCPNCGQQAPTHDAKFCINCGHQLLQPSPSSIRRPTAPAQASAPPLQASAHDDAAAPPPYSATPQPQARPNPPARRRPAPTRPAPLARPPPTAAAAAAVAPPQPQTSAERHAECPICFDRLADPQPVACFADARQRRVCRHYFHHTCAVSVAERNRSCPLCRTPFNEVLPVPKLSDNPRLWFQTVDTDGNGALSRDEVIDALKAQIPADWERIEREMVPGSWQRWDPDGDGQITFEELTGRDGLVYWFRENFPTTDRPPTPSIHDKHAWFEYWDEDNSGELDQEETQRALIKTFNLSNDLAQVENMRSIVENVWVLFDHDGDGTVSRQEFLRAGDGLADTIIASTQFD